MTFTIGNLLFRDEVDPTTAGARQAISEYTQEGTFVQVLDFVDGFRWKTSEDGPFREHKGHVLAFGWGSDALSQNVYKIDKDTGIPEDFIPFDDARWTDYSVVEILVDNQNRVYLVLVNSEIEEDCRGWLLRYLEDGTPDGEFEFFPDLSVSYDPGQGPTFDEPASPAGWGISPDGTYLYGMQFYVSVDPPAPPLFVDRIHHDILRWEIESILSTRSNIRQYEMLVTNTASGTVVTDSSIGAAFVNGVNVDPVTGELWTCLTYVDQSVSVDTAPHPDVVVASRDSKVLRVENLDSVGSLLKSFDVSSSIPNWQDDPYGEDPVTQTYPVRYPGIIGPHLAFGDKVWGFISNRRFSGPAQSDPSNYANLQIFNIDKASNQIGVLPDWIVSTTISDAFYPTEGYYISQYIGSDRVQGLARLNPDASEEWFKTSGF